MNREDIDDRITEYQYKFEAYRQHLYQARNSQNQSIKETLHQASELTSSLHRQIQHLLFREEKSQTDTRQIIWTDPTPTQTITYKLHSQVRSNTHNLESTVQNKVINLAIRFEDARQIAYSQKIVYESHSRTSIPDKFRLVFYLFGSRLTTEYLTIIEGEVYEWFDHHHFNKKRRHTLVYNIDLGSIKMPMIQRSFLESQVQIVCVDEDEFVLGTAECHLKQLISQVSSECEFTISNHRQFLSLTACVYTSLEDSLFKSQDNPLEIDVFWNQVTLLPVLLVNNAKFNKIFTLQFECKYSSLTFIVSPDQFRQYNNIPSYRYEQPKFISSNQIEVGAGEELVVYLLLLFERTEGQTTDRFLIHTMGISYTVNVMEYLKYDTFKFNGSSSIPPHRYIQMNGRVFFRGEEQIKIQTLNGVCGQYLKLQKSHLKVFPVSIQTLYRNDFTYIRCYFNTSILYRTSNNSIHFCNIEVVPSKGVYTLKVKNSQQPQQVDLSSCLQFEAEYEIVSDAESVRVLYKHVQFYQQARENRYVWVEVENLEKQAQLFVTNLESLKCISVLVILEGQNNQQ